MRALRKMDGKCVTLFEKKKNCYLKPNTYFSKNHSKLASPKINENQSIICV